MIPEQDYPYVVRLRKFLRDTPELNVLDKKEESSDDLLYNSLLDTIDEINVIGRITNYTKFSEIPWPILRNGAVLNVLTSIGILSARNTLTYQDSGGITVQDYDKYGRYVNYYNILVSKYYNMASSWKTAQNIDSCYGGVNSEFWTSNY